MNAIAVAYTHSYGSLLSLQIRWPSLLPSLKRLAEIFEQPWAEFTQLLESLANVLQFVNFDPSYFLRSASALSAVNFVLGLLKLLATYSSKAFAAVDTCFTVLRTVLRGNMKLGGATDEVTLQIHECVAPTEHAVMEALFARVGIDLEAEATVWMIANQGLTDDDMLAVSRKLRNSSGALPALISMSLGGNPGDDTPVEKALADRNK